jgi:integrase/recombinase XerD
VTKLRQRMTEELRLRNSSEDTIRSHIGSVERFARHYGKSPDRMDAEQVPSYLLSLLDERKLSWSAIHVNRSALRFLYVRVLKQRWLDEEIQRPKRHVQLPTILSAEEITRILRCDPEPEALDDSGDSLCHRCPLQRTPSAEDQ